MLHATHPGIILRAIFDCEADWPIIVPDMNVFLGIAQILLGVALIAVMLLQSKGEELGGVFGGGQGIYQTRRGFDRILFNITIFIAIAFFVLAIVNVIFFSASR